MLRRAEEKGVRPVTLSVRVRLYLLIFVQALAWYIQHGLLLKYFVASLFLLSWGFFLVAAMRVIIMGARPARIQSVVEIDTISTWCAT